MLFGHHSPGVTKNYFVKIVTPQGYCIVKLYNQTPVHRDNFTKLVKARYFDATTFNRILKGFVIQGGDHHPWLNLDDRQLLQTAGLWRKDLQTGREGYTLSAALLFGKEETIVK